jgi:sensor c-di-GMP phosphodiesterase-like protein
MTSALVTHILSRLAELPVDMLRIDRSFISGLTSTGAGRTVARPSLRWAGPSMTTVAEASGRSGSDAEPGLRQSRGYLHGRPLAAPDISQC